MNDDQLRNWLAGKLNRPFVPDHLWNRLDASTRDFARDGEVEREDLLKAAKEFVEYWRAEEVFIQQGGYEGYIPQKKEVAPPSGVISSFGTLIGRDEPISMLDEGQSVCFSAIIAESAARHPSVVEVRERILEFRLLDADKFLHFVESPANRFVSFSDLQSRSISPVEHEACVPEALIDDAIIDVDAYPTDHEYMIIDDPSANSESQQVTVEVQCQDRRVRIRRSTRHKADRVRYLARDSEEPEKVSFGHITIWPGSVISELWSVSETLSSESPWRVHEAFLFLLTGMFPMLSSVSSIVRTYPSIDNSSRYARISMSVVPWANSETVISRFLAEQEFLLGGKKRSFFAKNLTLTAFVTNRLIVSRLRNKTAPKWSVIRNEWNQMYPEWAYAEPNYLRNDFDRARKRIQNFPQAFPESFEEEMDRYDHLRRPIQHNLVYIDPVDDDC